jgi:predicted DNA-binding transcriptional regulator AlpA
MYNFANFIASTDRFGTAGSTEDQVYNLSKKLRIPIEDILMAVQEVGFDKDEVEEYIRDRYNRS